MATHVADGNVLLSPVTLKKLNRIELTQLEKEVSNLAREIRGDPPPLDDAVALQKRNRRLSRLNQAVLIVRNHRQSLR
jgi:hypothetical protein